MISGGKPGPHKIQGIGAGFIPRNLDTSLVDETVLVSNEEAFQWSRRLAKEEGIVAGISSGANMCAAAKVAARPEYKGKRIVVIMPSLGRAVSVDAAVRRADGVGGEPGELNRKRMGAVVSWVYFGGIAASMVRSGCGAALVRHADFDKLRLSRASTLPYLLR